MSKKNRFFIRSNFPIILASSSEIRKKMLIDLGLNFKVKPSNLDEDYIKLKYKNKPYGFISSKIAEEKGKKIANLYGNVCVVAADQICVFNKNILNKPLTKEKAVKQLLTINGKSHFQISSVSVYLNKLLIGKFTDTVKLKMRKLSKNIIEKYIEEDDPLHSCGAYKFEKKGKLLFSKVEGNVDTVLGLPILQLLNILYKNSIVYYE